MLTPRTAASPSRLVVRFALAGMTLAVVGLGALALWAAVVSETGASRVTSAAVQTAGHLQAVQALSKIDNQTDALEEEYDPRTVRSLRRAQRALDGAIDRMASGGEPEAVRISRQSRPIVRGMGTAVDQFVSAREGGDDERALERAEEAMEDRIHELETVMHEIRHDPSAVLTGELESVTDSLGDVRGAALVLVPLGLVFVGFAAWLLHGYRRRSEAAMLIALEASEVEARTDQLTGLSNRRALLEALDRAVESGGEFLLAVADLNGFKQYNDTFGHPAGDALLHRLADNLAARFDGHGTAARLGGDEFCVLVPAALGEDHVRTLVCDALGEQGEGFAITAACGLVALPRDARAADGVLRLADARMYADKVSSRPAVDQLVSRALLRMLDERHPGLGRHVELVAELAGHCAAALGLSPEDSAAVRRAAELHDIGKVAIPASILTKPDPLDAAEWDFMRRHTVIGERIIGAVPGLEAVAGMVRASHERWDGAGYPDGLGGDEIPLGARVVAVADAFCAMTEDRPYAQARPVHDAIAELEACAGTQFDPAVVAAFADALRAAGSLAAAA
jgi:diguanylate cyclase (GGDEF)-like protein